MGNGDLMKGPDNSNVRTIVWDNPVLKLIDQRKLPFEETYYECKNCGEVAEAIKKMVVRGAPAIGVAAAYGVAMAALNFREKSKVRFFAFIDEKISGLSASRPTAVNLFWSINRMKRIIAENKGLGLEGLTDRLVLEAEKIEEEDLRTNHLIGENGLEVFENHRGKIKVLTHCNAGALATSGYGTALGVIRSLNRMSKIANVIVDETRPFLQGARLTAWELHREKIPYFVISDNMAGYFMSEGEVDAVAVGADRIASNGDTANKIGTLSLSVLAKNYGIPFYICAPLSTIDMDTSCGKGIPVEQRDGREVREILGKPVIPEYMPVMNPAFDITPAENITAIITEKGVIYPPFDKNIKKIFDNKN